jgi:hypothetical protein
MKVDTAGSVCGGSGGIWVVDPKGKESRIVHEPSDQHRLRRRRLETPISPRGQRSDQSS